MELVGQVFVYLLPEGLTLTRGLVRDGWKVKLFEIFAGDGYVPDIEFATVGIVILLYLLLLTWDEIGLLVFRSDFGNFAFLGFGKRAPAGITSQKVLLSRIGIALVHFRTHNFLAFLSVCLARVVLGDVDDELDSGVNGLLLELLQALL